MRFSYVTWAFALLFLFANTQKFTYKDYQEIIDTFTSLSKKYPNLLRIDSTQNMYGIPKIDCDDIECIQLVAFVTENSVGEAELKKKPHIFLSGGVHGNERIGQNTLTYLTQYLLENYEKDPWIKHMLDTRAIVMTPMTNAQGYYLNDRGETYQGSYYDVNRDFPYDVQNENCGHTLTSRGILHLLNEYMCVHGISFHGGTTVIAYQYGSPNHAKGFWPQKSTHAPDRTAMRDTAFVLQKEAGTVPAYNIGEYEVGAITTIIYSARGAMANWAYSYSWGNDFGMDGNPAKCDAEGFDQNLLKSNKNSVRFPLYVIETDYAKTPQEDTLGSWEGLTEKGTAADGHVSRNMRVCLALMDLTIPSVWNVNQKSTDAGLEVDWTVNGALKVDETYIQYEYTNDKGAELTKKTEAQSGDGRWGESPTTFKATIPAAPAGKKVTFKIVTKVDMSWKNNPEPDPADVGPQAHFTRMRTEGSYSASNDHNSLSFTNPFSSEVYQSEGRSKSIFSIFF